jgi:hypothetical protein
MPHEFGYPGIPTNLQNRSKTRFDNDNLSQRQQLGIIVEKPRPSMGALYEDEPSVEELLAQAQGTLNSTAQTANQLKGAGLQVHNPGDIAAERAQMASQRNAAMEVLRSGAGAASMIPGPAGLAGRAGMGALGIYDLSTADDAGDVFGGALEASVPLVDIIPAVRGARNASRLAQVNVGKHGPANAPMQGAARSPMPYKFNGITNPSSASPPSIAALADDSVGYPGSGQIDLSGALDELAGPSLSPQEIAVSRAAERFGKPYRSERTVPKARSVGMQDDDVPFEMFEHEIAPGKFSTGATADDLNRRGIPLPASAAAVDEHGLRRLITSLFGDNPSPAVSRLTAAEALADDAVIGYTKKGKPITASSVEQSNPLFGGASSREYGSGPEAGEFVRPSKRTPIGKKPAPPWRIGREEAIVWNP